MRLLTTLLFALVLTGCQARADAPRTLFDYRLLDAGGQPVPLTEAIPRLAEADVIMVGELHGHSGVHRFQAELLAALLARPRPMALAMEQFSRDRQTELNAYLAGKLGEDAFIEQANAWPGYRSDYRPLVELAKAAGIDVLAANAPRAIVRCIGREGPDYLSRLPDSHRGWVAERLTLEDDAYKARFMATRFHGQAPTDNQFAAQTSWDDTMAESIQRYLARHPGYRVMLTVGRFHISDGLGTVQRLARRNPKLNIALIYPVLPDEAAPPAPIWSLRVQALPASRLPGEPLPAISASAPDC
ncbi:ChaN family lipoprotein [Oceanimonas sp. CHS3-5]|uniref:ChaN family lipoprotein n=1 Tax=Oceanimonas sp. CHS3-5 TaxID=3068186 RepID=UPI00273EE7C8|nr:ChaN family lipoprotein [Oceanimonas sp. CHS3-5]MDP5292331.1 ChaN family lipoprotein [Oceanimonas sp. CHS3-5]